MVGDKQRYAAGAVVSPLIANVYLHYCLDLWADVWRRKVANGDVIIVRYADDIALASSTEPRPCGSSMISRNGWQSSARNSIRSRPG